jgi:hypothetical protein
MTASGAGFTAKPSSPQTSAATCSRMPSAPQGGIRRGAVVGRDDRDPPALGAQPPKIAPRSAEWYGQGRRIGDQPRRGRRTAAAAMLGHQRRRTRATVSSMPAIGPVASGPRVRRVRSWSVETDRREDVRRHRPADDVVQPGSELALPSRPTSRGNR